MGTSVRRPCSFFRLNISYIFFGGQWLRLMHVFLYSSIFELDDRKLVQRNFCVVRHFNYIQHFPNVQIFSVQQ